MPANLSASSIRPAPKQGSVQREVAESVAAGPFGPLGRLIARYRDWHIDTAQPLKSVVFLSGPRAGGQLAPVSGDSSRGAEFSAQFYALSTAIEAGRRKRLESMRADQNPAAAASSFVITVEGARCRVQAVQDNKYHVRVPSAHLPLARLGIPESLSALLMSPDLNAGGGGLVVVCGGFGCGKTTTVNAVIRERITTQGGYALMLGAPIEYEFAGHHGSEDALGYIEQIDLAGLDPTAEIRASMRSFPGGATSILAYPELLGHEGVGEMLRTANSGNLVFAEMHAKDIEGCIYNLVSYASLDRETFARELLANSLRLIVHQTMTLMPGSTRGVHVSYRYLRVEKTLRMALADASVPLAKAIGQALAVEASTGGGMPR